MKYKTVQALLLSASMTVGASQAAELSCTTTQITNLTIGQNDGPSISADGTLIAFDSNSDLTGQNADLNGEIFLFDTVAATVRQITHSSKGGAFGASISADGIHIAFHANVSPLGNVVQPFNVFFFDRSTSFFGSVRSPAEGFSLFPSVDADGTRIFFHSNRNHSGGNADGNFEIFRYDTKANTLVQITNTVGGSNSFPSVSANSTRVAFRSDRNLTGSNTDSIQRFSSMTESQVLSDRLLIRPEVLMQR